jgi:SAM-dependent methyltransferase
MPLWKRQPPPHVIAQTMRQWFASELGAELLAQEQRLIGSELTNLFGYHLLQLGFNSDVPLFGECRVQRCFQAGPVPSPIASDYPFVQCAFEGLPFESDSLDGVIVQHVLEFATNPHAVLRELYRVTVPNGRVLIVGFNPWSLFGLRMLGGRLRPESLWHNHLLSASRVTDWLELLGFTVQKTEFGFHRLPFHRTAQWLKSYDDSSWSPSLRRLPVGAVYVLTAVKQVMATTQLKPRWRPVVSISPLPVVKPSAVVGQRRDVNDNA